ncbi:DUF1506 family protein [Borrelia miyamotoi]|uniref:DUF1506 family protein n=1 Tax=Borrelia miyamotoi TaxID=47466 RepID=A0AAQ2WZ52_9SPIR|nr:DUF1506 family protein [Borrelia miyamotoi]AOW96381.1 hypothetical protein AXH25_04410 [Borrelia miyamotoi]QTL84099.1 DUF1506 family protein [Borrelia miyamotoi]WAZ85738.1 DUF1506 family protein [Borrelia miyamotoi]WAZ91520.1 DUF1506 family protein [Borrelia miyamotoi]WAZ92808.1 DUF1506 family protein [Borrelia miyamotoi]
MVFAGLKGINLAIIKSIKRYSRQMFLFRKMLIKNRHIASYEKKVDKANFTEFKGVFLFHGEDKIELFGSNIFARETYAKVYTLSILDFKLEDHVLVDDNFLEIISANKCFKQTIGYTVLMLRLL